MNNNDNGKPPYFCISINSQQTFPTLFGYRMGRKETSNQNPSTKSQGPGFHAKTTSIKSSPILPFKFPGIVAWRILLLVLCWRIIIVTPVEWFSIKFRLSLNEVIPQSLHNPSTRAHLCYPQTSLLWHPLILPVFDFKSHKNKPATIIFCLRIIKLQRASIHHMTNPNA